MNSRESEILNLISKREAPAGPVAPTVWFPVKPGAPSIPEVIAAATGTASPEVAARVRAYCAGDPEYAELLDSYEHFVQQTDVELSPIAGSILEGMTVKNLAKPRTPPPHAIPESKPPTG